MHNSGFPPGIESRDPDIPSCWHSGTMRRSCCWSIPCHNQADPLWGNDTPASERSRAMFGGGNHGVSESREASKPPEPRRRPSRVMPRIRRRRAAAPSERRVETRACGGGRSWSRSALASPGRYTLPADGLAFLN
jgi:hypothetical protein